MGERYSSNLLFISKNEQKHIKNYPVLIAGCGIGSVIAECALRMGFENITLIDQEIVKTTDLSSENFSAEEVGRHKAVEIRNKLLTINQDANISIHFHSIDNVGLLPVIEKQKIAINSFDLNSDASHLIDTLCQSCQIPVLHPFNLGWAALLTVVAQDGLPFPDILKKQNEGKETGVLEYFSGYLEFWGNKKEWLKEIIRKYKSETERQVSSNLSVANWLLASMCTHIAFDIASQKQVKIFPEFYLSSVYED